MFLIVSPFFLIFLWVNFSLIRYAMIKKVYIRCKIYNIVQELKIFMSYFLAPTVNFKTDFVISSCEFLGHFVENTGNILVSDPEIRNFDSCCKITVLFVILWVSLCNICDYFLQRYRVTFLEFLVTTVARSNS